MSHLWRCKQCGIEMLSKCPSARSVFVRYGESYALEQLEFTWRNIGEVCKKALLDAKEQITSGEIVFRFEYTSVQGILHKIRMLSEKDITRLLCLHEWISTEDYECCVGHQHKAGE